MPLSVSDCLYLSLSLSLSLSLYIYIYIYEREWKESDKIYVKKGKPTKDILVYLFIHSFIFANAFQLENLPAYKSILSKYYLKYENKNKLITKENF